MSSINIIELKNQDKKLVWWSCSSCGMKNWEELLMAFLDEAVARCRRCGKKSSVKGNLHF